MLKENEENMCFEYYRVTLMREKNNYKGFHSES